MASDVTHFEEAPVLKPPIVKEKPKPSHRTSSEPRRTKKSDSDEDKRRPGLEPPTRRDAIEEKKIKEAVTVVPEIPRVAEVDVEPVAVDVDVAPHRPVAKQEPTETELSSIPRSRTSPSVANSVTLRHAKDEDDPGRIFKMSSYNSFQPVVRRSASMLEKIKLFSEAAESAKEQVHLRHSVPSFNPLLPKNFPSNMTNLAANFLPDIQNNTLADCIDVEVTSFKPPLPRNSQSNVTNLAANFLPDIQNNTLADCIDGEVTSFKPPLPRNSQSNVSNLAANFFPDIHDTTHCNSVNGEATSFKPPLPRSSQSNVTNLAANFLPDIHDTTHSNSVNGEATSFKPPLPRNSQSNVTNLAANFLPDIQNTTFTNSIKGEATSFKPPSPRNSLSNVTNLAANFLPNNSCNTNGEVKEVAQKPKPSKKLAQTFLSEANSSPVGPIVKSLEPIPVKETIQETISTLAKKFSEISEEKTRPELFPETKEQVSAKKQLFEASGAEKAEPEEPERKSVLLKLDSGISERRQMFNSGKPLKPDREPESETKSVNRKRKPVKRISFSDEKLKDRTKAMAEQIFAANRDFLETMKLSEKTNNSGEPKKSGKRKMLADCDLGSSTYRDWNIPEIFVDEYDGDVTIESLDLASTTSTMSPKAKKSASKRLVDLNERGALSDNDTSDFKDLTNESLIPCYKRVQPPRNSKPKHRKSAEFSRAKSVEVEFEKWDHFLKEVGRLSVEIDDENETFI